MRRINLKDSDTDLFNHDITPADNAFMSKHMDALKRMWHEQGKEFWARYAMNFISCAAQFGVMKDFPESPETSQEILERIFCLIMDQFILGKYSQAKSLLMDIVVVAKNMHLLPHLEANSFVRDPFYVKDTRDSFRNLFGPPDLKTSYMNVYVLLPVYSRFGGSVCVGLRRWLSAPTMDTEDSSYWTTPSGSSTGRFKALSSPEFKLYVKERLQGSRSGPRFVKHWMFEDPRFADQDNPLYDPIANKLSDWREHLRPTHYIAFVKYVDEHYNPAKHKSGMKDVTAIAKKKILEERLWEQDDDDLPCDHEECMHNCHCPDDPDCENDVVWCSEREYLPDISHCGCCYIKDRDYLDDPYTGRIRTDSERSTVIYYTMCCLHNDNMRIEVPVNLSKYRAYPEQPLCEVEMEMSDTAKNDIIRYVVSIVCSGIRPLEIPEDPVEITGLPLYITVTVKWCENVHGLRIDHDLREMRKRAHSLKLGYGGLRSIEDVTALAKAVTETTQSFISVLPYCDRIAESCLHQESRDSSARQRLKKKMKQKKKQQESLKAKRAERDAKALLELFKFEIKNGFYNPVTPKAGAKQDISLPKESQVREQMKKELHKLRDYVSDINFSKNKDDWLSEEQTFTECLEQAMEQTGVKVTTELGFPFGRNSYYKLLHRTPGRSCVQVLFNTSCGPRHVLVRLSATTRCHNDDKSKVQTSCPHHTSGCPHHETDHEQQVKLVKNYLGSLFGWQEADNVHEKENDVPREVNNLATESVKGNSENQAKLKTVEATKQNAGAVKNTVEKFKESIATPTAVQISPKSVVSANVTISTSVVGKSDSTSVSKTSICKPKVSSTSVPPKHVSTSVSETSVCRTNVSSTSTPPKSVATSSSSPTHSVTSSGSAQLSSGKSKKLRKCHFCQNTEPEPKSYKKCNKCKTDGIKNARFYCGKECQTNDWKIRHKEEHRNNALEKL